MLDFVVLIARPVLRAGLHPGLQHLATRYQDTFVKAYFASKLSKKGRRKYFAIELFSLPLSSVKEKGWGKK